MGKFARVLEVLESLEDNELLALHRAYCERNSYMEDYVFEMWQFDEHFEGCTPLEILDAVDCNRFSTGDSYWAHTIWDVVSSDYVSDLIDLDDLARNIVRTGNDYGNSVVAEALEEEEEEGEE